MIRAVVVKQCSALKPDRTELSDMADNAVMRPRRDGRLFSRRSRKDVPPVRRSSDWSNNSCACFPKRLSGRPTASAQGVDAAFDTQRAGVSTVELAAVRCNLVDWIRPDNWPTGGCRPGYGR
jgi:hypothetical protein